MTSKVSTFRVNLLSTAVIRSYQLRYQINHYLLKFIERPSLNVKPDNIALRYKNVGFSVPMGFHAKRHL